MENAYEHTSSAAYIPRPPNTEEQKQLAAWLLSTGAYDAENARLTAEAAYVAVFDHYCTGGPGYAGKVMSVIWDGSPSTFDLFTWKDGAMERSGREYDEKECYRCGGIGGTLCSNCWRVYSGQGTEELVAALEDAISVLDVAKQRDPGQAGLYHCPAARAALAEAQAKRRAMLVTASPTRSMATTTTSPQRLRPSTDSPWTPETWAAARADSRWADERWAADMRERFRRYPSLRLRAKICLAMAILHDVANTWDNDTLVHYPADLPSFDEYLAEIGIKLYDIHWNDDGNAA